MFSTWFGNLTRHKVIKFEAMWLVMLLLIILFPRRLFISRQNRGAQINERFDMDSNK